MPRGKKNPILLSLAWLHYRAVKIQKDRETEEGKGQKEREAACACVFERGGELEIR